MVAVVAVGGDEWHQMQIDLVAANLSGVSAEENRSDLRKNPKIMAMHHMVVHI